MLSSSQYVYSQNKTGSELNTNFAALAVKNRILRAFESRKSSIHEDMVKKYDELKEFIQAALEGFKESIEEAARDRIYLKEPVE